jgi:hypothetical protein
MAEDYDGYLRLGLEIENGNRYLDLAEKLED